MSRARLAREEAALEARREAYARVTVVWSRSPTSARPGDAALVTADGSLRGWVGGSCAEPVVVREALSALADGTPRMLHVGPPDDLPASVDGMVVKPMGCASEGALRLFVEPRLPPPHLVVVGRAPVVDVLVAMASVVGYDARAVEHDPSSGSALDLADDGVTSESFVVVATMGRYDEDALEAALANGARYVALIASPRRAATVLETLRSMGVPEGDVARVRAPAGLDLGDLRHEEIAVAVLAQIVLENAARAVPVPGSDGARASAAAVPRTSRPGPGAHPGPVDEAVDPVCGMTVDPATAAARLAHEGRVYWFCSTGCRRRFETDPTRYLAGSRA